jgi:hypothetical protein
MDKVAKLRNELEALQKGIDNPSTPANFKEKMRSTMTVIQGKIDAELKKEGTPEKKTRKSAPKKESSKGGRKDNASFKKAQEIAKELKAKDPSLPHTKAISMAWASMKGEAPKKETPKKEAPKKEAPKKEDTKTRAKNLKAKVKKVGGTYSYKVKGTTKTFTRDKDKDGNRLAKHVGRRVSKDGNVYYEYRDNRADTNIGKPSYKKPRLFAKGGMMYEDGGRLSDMADYVTKYKVKSVEVEMDGKTVTLDGSQLMDGIYVKKNSFEYGGMMAKGGSTESGVTVEVRSTNSSNTLLMEKSFDTMAKAKAYSNKINNDLSDSPRIDILGYDAKGKMVVEFYDFGSLDESDIEAGMEFYKPVNWKLKMVALNKKTFANSTIFTFSGSYKECEKLFNLIDMEGVEAVIKGGSYADGGMMAKGGIYSSDDEWVVTFQDQDSGEFEKVFVMANNYTSAIDIAYDESNLGSNWDLYSVEKYMADGGMTGGMYKIVDLDGDTVESNLTEQGVIEFADTLGYYEAQDNEQEPIYNLDSAISLIEMEGDYNVVKMAEYGGFMKRGGDTGNYNYGRSYFQDRARIAKKQDYEKYYHRKGK